MDPTLTPAQQRARLHQLLDTLPDTAVAAWLQLLDASATPPTAPAPRGEASLHLRVLKHMNYDGQDQHGLPIEWCVRS